MRNRVAACGFVFLLVPLASGTTYLVKPDGTGDFPTIQAAIDAADSADVIELASGTFFAEGNRNIDFFGKAITVRSEPGNPEQPIIDCGYDGRGFDFHSGETPLSVLQGVAITNGFLMIGGYGGGGMSCTDGSCPTLIRCTVSDNVGFSKGGGLMCEGYSCPTLTNCTFLGNATDGYGGAIHCADYSDCAVDSCTFTDNTAGDGSGAIRSNSGSGCTIHATTIHGNTTEGNGGGIGCNGAEVTLFDTILSGNTATTGGAVYGSSSSTMLFTDCSFLDNSAVNDAGAMACLGYSGPVLTRCIFSGNSAANDDGGALFCRSASPTLTECVFSTNSAADCGGAVYSESSNPSLHSCSFTQNHAGNDGAGLYVTSSSSAIIDNCTFSANSADSDGGAIYCYSVTTCELSSCTLYANAGCFGGGIYGHYSSLILDNSIIAYGTGGGSISGSGSPDLSCCDIFGNQGGDWVGWIAFLLGIGGNISEPPLFCDPGGGDLHLAEDSPCAPFSPPNTSCDLIGAWPVGCGMMAIREERNLAQGIILSQNIPNPFSFATQVAYTVAGTSPAAVHLAIYDTAGRLIRTLAVADRAPGAHTTSWDGNDDAGSRVAAGAYFYRLTVGEETATRRMLLVR